MQKHIRGKLMRKEEDPRRHHSPSPFPPHRPTNLPHVTIPCLIVTPYPGLERLPGAASCSTFRSLGGPLEWGAVNARFYPFPLFPESVSSVGCLFPPTADAQGTTSPPLQERLSQRKRHRPSFPNLSSASRGPFGGFSSHLHRTEWGK